jgi:hypothetical protein
VGQCKWRVSATNPCRDAPSWTPLCPWEPMKIQKCEFILGGSRRRCFQRMLRFRARFRPFVDERDGSGARHPSRESKNKNEII